MTFKKEQIVARDEKFDSAKFYIEHGIDVGKRRIMIDEDIDEYSCGWAIRGIHKMMDASKTDPIDIYVNSFGGGCYDGLALIDTIQSCEYATVRTHAVGKVMSMGFMIFLSGDERYASPNTTLMLHTVSSEMWGKAFELKTESNEVERLKKILFTMIADKSNKTYDYWAKHLKYEDRYYTTEQAKKLGFVNGK